MMHTSLLTKQPYRAYSDWVRMRRRFAWRVRACARLNTAKITFYCIAIQFNLRIRWKIAQRSIFSAFIYMREQSRGWKCWKEVFFYHRDFKWKAVNYGSFAKISVFINADVRSSKASRACVLYMVWSAYFDTCFVYGPLKHCWYGNCYHLDVT